ncbi:MAG: 50S ribosomal protein L23 [Gemmatimonadota bacterium]
MRDIHDVIVSPVVTEKATLEMEGQNVYTFIVHPEANKLQIAEAVERAWDVVVKDVRTARYQGKARRALMGRMSPRSPVGRRPAFKKAMVRLAEGDSIEFYEAG